MGFFDKLETRLDVWLRQKAPFQLPSDGRKGLAGALWWIALIVGIVQLWGAWMLWHAGHIIGVTNQQYVDEVYGASAADTVHLGLFYWFSFLAIAVVAVLMLLAAPQLKQMKKAGWTLLYYAIVVNALFALLRLLSGVDGVVSGFISAVVGTLVGAYLLFQVRDQFSGRHRTHAARDAHHQE